MFLSHSILVQKKDSYGALYLSILKINGTNAICELMFTKKCFLGALILPLCFCVINDVMQSFIYLFIFGNAKVSWNLFHSCVNIHCEP